MTESEEYGTSFGAYADELLREYYRMGKVYADHAGIATVNPQLLTAYRGCDIATEVYTNALMITPGNGGTYLTRVYPPPGAQGVIAGRTWMTNGVACIAPIQAAYRTNQLAEIFEGDGVRQMAMAPTNHVFNWSARPQFFAVGILGNLVFPGETAAEAYYRYIGSEKLFDRRPINGWLDKNGLLTAGSTNLVTVPPSVLGRLYRQCN